MNLFKGQINRITLSFSIITSLFLFLTITAHSSQDNLIYLKNLDFSNPSIKILRNDIRKGIYTIRSNRDSQTLPKLLFYKYNVQKSDNFWKILSRCSLNIDTLMSVNSLSSPGDISPGQIIFIPNMRGIVYENGNGDSIETIAKKFNIEKYYIYQINNITGGTKSHLFIPGGEISKTERSLFLGTGFSSPLKIGRLTSGFGRRKDPFNRTYYEFHKGIDIACSPGTRIHAARSGRVVFTGYKGGYGNLVVIQHSHNYFSYYGHLKRILIKKGDAVGRGTLIALSGNTGRSTGPHLHFEVRKNKRPINPGLLFRKI